jgi:purine-cytosine permease-like protein
MTNATETTGSSWAENREDYAQERVPLEYRKWSTFSLFGVMFGITTAMFFLSWGGTLVLAYGTQALVWGMVIAGLAIGGLAYAWSKRASETGLGADLLTRSSGFGYYGSAVTSLIYTLTFVMFFAFEGSIMANAIHAQWSSIPIWLIYVVTGLAFIPLTWFGMRLMTILMWVTLPIYTVFLVITIVKAGGQPSHVDFWSYMPGTVTNPGAGPGLLQVLAAALAVVSQVTISADMGRFIPPRRRTSGALILGFFSQILTFVGCVILGGWLTLRFGVSDPGRYLPGIMGAWGVLFVIITQIRINVTNVYSGSIIYSTLFTRIFGFSPGRHWWVVLTAGLGTLLMFGGIYAHLNQVLTFEAVLIIAWVMAVVADMFVIKRWLKLVSEDAPYEKHELRRFNPVGLVAVGVALTASLPLAFGATGPLGMTLAPFVSGVLAFVVAPIVAVATKGRFYSPVASTTEPLPAAEQLAEQP